MQHSRDAVTQQTAVEHIELTPTQLIEQAILRQEGMLSHTGALAVTTGARTGRSPKDRYIVKDEATERHVDWGVVNQPISAPCFQALWQRVEAYLQERDQFSGLFQVGADQTHHLTVHARNEFAWHHLFISNLFIKQATPQASKNNHWQLLHAPSFQADPKRDGVRSEAAVMLNFTEKKVLICGTHYAGEMKKAFFTVLNFLLPQVDVLPMHCAANADRNDAVTIFFGLSGTGKTTLSADPDFALIGDDEHGWHSEGVFNFEGGCYAKCINLSQEKEPTIWQAIRYGAVMENVVLDPETRIPDYRADQLTQNTRAAYPRSHIENSVADNQGQTPQAVVFLTCDLYGVLPPVSILTREQAAYHFLSGYTALVGSTEVGHEGTDIQPTFSTCFGAPFFPRSPKVYAELLMKRIAETDCPVYLVNTGWTGGAYGQGGQRFEIKTTRAIIHAIQSGALRQAETQVITDFALHVPKQLPGVDATLLNPVQTWSSSDAFEQAQRQLVEKFVENFKRFSVSEAILSGGPILAEALV